MKIQAVDIKPGVIIEYENDLWRCLKSQAVKPGKGGAYNQVELKSITKGTKLNERFRSDETIEKASLEEKDFSYLYQEGQNFVFMDSTSFEQIFVPKDIVGEHEEMLKENMNVVIELHDEKPLILNMPNSADFEVLETESVVKGQTASSSYKPATIQNGVKIMVPPFINQGDLISVNCNTREYIKKAN